MSKGSIVSAQTITNPSNPDVFKIMLDRELAQKISPKARIVVWCVASNSEVISDTIEFNVDGAFANEVRIKYIVIGVGHKHLFLQMLSTLACTVS